MLARERACALKGRGCCASDSARLMTGQLALLRRWLRRRDSDSRSTSTDLEAAARLSSSEHSARPSASSELDRAEAFAVPVANPALRPTEGFGSVPRGTPVGTSSCPSPTPYRSANDPPMYRSATACMASQLSPSTTSARPSTTTFVKGAGSSNDPGVATEIDERVPVAQGRDVEDLAGPAVPDGAQLRWAIPTFGGDDRVLPPGEKAPQAVFGHAQRGDGVRTCRGARHTEGYSRDPVDGQRASRRRRNGRSASLTPSANFVQQLNTSASITAFTWRISP